MLKCQKNVENLSVSWIGTTTVELNMAALQNWYQLPPMLQNRLIFHSA